MREAPSIRVDVKLTSTSFGISSDPFLFIAFRSKLGTKMQDPLYPELLDLEFFHSPPLFLRQDQGPASTAAQANGGSKIAANPELDGLRKMEEEICRVSESFWQWDGDGQLPKFLVFYVDGPFCSIFKQATLFVDRSQLDLISELAGDLIVLAYSYEDKRAWSAAMALRDHCEKVGFTSYQRFHRTRSSLF